MFRILLFSLAFLTLLTGCAGVKFTSSPHESRDSGFLFYPPKPYLVVEPTEKGPQAKLLILPDVSRPSYVRYDRGWGTIDFRFEIENGMIKSFGQTLDSKGPETITAVAGGFASALTGLAGIGVGSAQAAQLQSFATVTPTNQNEAQVTVEPVLAAANLLEGTIQSIKTSNIGPSSGPASVAELEKVLATLRTYQKIDLKRDDNLLEKLGAVVKSVAPTLQKIDGARSYFKQLVALPNSPSDKLQDFVLAQQQLDKVVGQLLGFVTAPGEVRIYALESNNGSVRLSPVVFP